MALWHTGRALTLLLLTSCSASVLATEDDATVWLERMIHSSHQLNYSGTFVYQQDGTLQSMKIFHAVNEYGESERLVSLTGPNREVIRNRERVTCFLPENSPIVVEQLGSPRPFPLKLPADLGSLREHYDISLEGEDRIAGLSARKVVIAPRDNYRYGQHFWVADDSGLLLRAEIVNDKGAIIEQLMFTSLEMHDTIPDALLQLQFSGETRVLELDRQPWAERVEPLATAQQQRWQVAALPPGFLQQLKRNHYLPDKDSPVEHHVYSDGLASVSVFVEMSSEDENAYTGASSMGGVNAYSRQMDSHSVTVVGEVPPVTVKQIAESLQPIQP
ncbi:MAG: MucB/RseB C-terminal domain-containing protein [Gammaproteobacteria bacterium]|nr:MucB/RseB C-terminal domain-containing protein [Gammaproteobacteria bacterium]MCW8928256.1 MucB/RseB C-terminal domain-containing protein [Gammaproteobacteria bacterium]MCW8958716.1 MucB/RseB C-terminal domain-containing protein [Gammaproteobacteria bacterium]MCW8973250.1 MucB/RseB C-terminal domain-containing protein [Gammaproteobacteria bacterium]MCW8993527.1 MucB/RseB C-terminal domain-containing protein [Gammaproteobacteria bacterium]